MMNNEEKREFINPFLELKKERLDKICKMIGALRECDYGRFVALIQINIGVSDKIARDYIQLLRNADYIVINNGKIYPHTHTLSHTLSESKKKKKSKK